MPDMPPNTDSEQANTGSLVSPALLTSGYGSVSDMQSLMAVSQTIGALTTLANTSVQQSQHTQSSLNGAADLRPQNMFHRDEMF